MHRYGRPSTASTSPFATCGASIMTWAVTAPTLFDDDDEDEEGDEDGCLLSYLLPPLPPASRHHQARKRGAVLPARCYLPATASMQTSDEARKQRVRSRGRKVRFASPRRLTSVRVVPRAPQSLWCDHVRVVLILRGDGALRVVLQVTTVPVVIPPNTGYRFRWSLDEFE
jgi:hypothetical protein